MAAQKSDSEEDCKFALMKLVKGLQKENSVLRRRKSADLTDPSQCIAIQDDISLREEYSETINKLEKRITRLQEIVTDNHLKIVEYEAVKRHFGTLDATIKKQKTQIDELIEEKAVMKQYMDQLSTEHANLLATYENELRLGDLARKLCIDLDDENKRLYEGIQPFHQGTPVTPIDYSNTPPNFHTDPIGDLSLLSTPPAQGGFDQAARVRRRDRRLLGQLTARICRTPRRPFHSSESTDF